MNLNGFHIDIDSSDAECLPIDVDGFTVIVKRETEGIVVDVYPLHVVDEPITSTYTFRSDTEARDEQE